MGIKDHVPGLYYMYTRALFVWLVCVGLCGLILQFTFTDLPMASYGLWTMEFMGTSLWARVSRASVPLSQQGFECLRRLRIGRRREVLHHPWVGGYVVELLEIRLREIDVGLELTPALEKGVAAAMASSSRLVVRIKRRTTDIHTGTHSLSPNVEFGIVRRPMKLLAVSSVR